MAAITVGTLHPCSPPGYEVNDRAQAATAITKGQLLTIAATAPGNGYDYVVGIAATTALYADGIALKDAVAGGTVSVGVQGEMDGFTGMTPGTPLYPSGATAGGLDTTAPTEFATTPAAKARAQVKAVTATRIRYSFV